MLNNKQLEIRRRFVSDQRTPVTMVLSRFLLFGNEKSITNRYNARFWRNGHSVALRTRCVMPPVRYGSYLLILRCGWIIAAISIIRINRHSTTSDLSYLSANRTLRTALESRIFIAARKCCRHVYDNRINLYRNSYIKARSFVRTFSSRFLFYIWDDNSWRSLIRSSDF